MDATELAFTGLARQAEMVRAREVSPLELVELYLERIERIDPKLDAFRVVLGERALAEARQAEGRVGAGEDRPLLGVPVAVKDNLGLAGLKTQRGRVSLMPFPEHWHGVSVAGSVTRTVLDAAVWLDAVSGPASGDVDRAEPPARPFAESARTPPGRLRVMVSAKSPIPLVKVYGPAKEAVRETAEVLRSLGHEVIGRNPKYTDVRSSFLPRWLRGIADDANGMPDPERLEKRTRSLAGVGRRIGDRGLRRAREREARMTAKIAAIFDQCDVLVTPTIPHPPREVGRYDGRGWLWATMGAANTTPSTIPWNVTGQPAISVPAPSLHDGLPMGVTLVGRPHDESTLISLAAQLAPEAGWPDRRPPVD